MNGLNLYCYANNNPVEYGSLSVGANPSGKIINGNVTGPILAYSSNNRTLSRSTKEWIHLQSIPSWVNDVNDIADIGFSASIVALTGWYTLRYPGVAELMRLDGISSIPGKYSDFVEGLGYAFVFLETGIDVYNNWYQGQRAEYILASGAYTLGTGLAITWGSAKAGAYIGNLVAGPTGLIVGGIMGLLIGIALDILSDEIKELIF